MMSMMAFPDRFGAVGMISVHWQRVKGRVFGGSIQRRSFALRNRRPARVWRGETIPWCFLASSAGSRILLIFPFGSCRVRTIFCAFRWHAPWNYRASKAIPAFVFSSRQVLYGLRGSVWTNDISLAIETARSWINGGSRHFIGAPFGGYKQSGLGREESHVTINVRV
ncbi:MAG: aldehyde dehydrogenase family protein [Candidatus Tectomicrobia bacterium]|uniref:Aldehyde dehydrogenase family protein n=1 Tax=Tectimicrobiota bacterium TaxID=2528274 RepID=A0A932GQK4_UNCTE|nr:aldehyde dehydrogenase family protein [Candidatus Tectomicrobia bacterium]